MALLRLLSTYDEMCYHAKSTSLIGVYVNTLEIPLTQDKIALIDEADYHLIEPYTWCAAYVKRTWYALSNLRVHEMADGQTKTIRMHRLILGVDPGVQVDHENRDGLDNRRQNLRIAETWQNCANIGPYNNNQSGYKGVTLYCSGNYRRWKATIRDRKLGHQIHLGYFLTVEEAAMAYDARAREIFGKFAYQNFPQP
jgi:hypothetical protein